MSFEEQGYFDKVYHRNGKLYKKVNKECIQEMIDTVNSKSFSNKDLLIVDITDEEIRSYSKMLENLESEGIEDLSVKLDKLKYKVYLRLKLKD
jgi:CHASE2 domain-containing sensor protein